MKEDKLEKPITTLICCCCGQYTSGRQWWNRDTGYGLCSKCVPYCKRGEDETSFKQCYGIDGYNYNVKESL